MQKLNYNILELAEMELIREGRAGDKRAGQILIDRAYTILKWLDKSEQHKKIALAKWRNKK